MDLALAVKNPISDAIRVPFCHEGALAPLCLPLDDSLVALVLLAALICTGVESRPWWAPTFPGGTWADWGDKGFAKSFLMLQHRPQSFWSCASSDIHVACGNP